ncbi:MAG: hypothetical protein Q8T03_13410 [Bacteroidota bacterium]|nr:hypothetical protein [Bacteroidota bacterium]MDP3558364.1 hypothetical protein [Bacteroidota bacterium]
MSEEKNTNNSFMIRAYTKKELRQLYGIPKSTFLRWLLPLRSKLKSQRSNWLTAAEVECFVKEYGFPGIKNFS